VCAAHALGLLTNEQAADKKAEINARLDALRAGLFGERRRTAKQQQLDAMQAEQGGNDDVG